MNLWTFYQKSRNSFFDSVKLLEKALIGFDRLNLPPIIVVANKKIGTGGISSYNHVNDVIYFNSFYHTQERIDHVIDEGTFAAQDLSGIIRHKLGHKLHWDAVKRFYRAHKSKYNNIEEAKHDLDAPVESYVARAFSQDNMYLEKSLSYYASISYKFAKSMKSDNLVNEIIAETYTSQQPHDQILYELTRKLINYGKRN